MARILCIEAGTDIGSVALGENGKLISLRESTEGREHARNLAVYVDEILRENDLDATDLDAIAIGKGPGSYTGLRICTALAKGLCYGAQIPLIAIGSLEALCRVALEDYEAGVLDLDEIQGSTLLPMIDARRMEVYCQLFDEKAHPLSEAEAHILTPESFLPQRQSSGQLVLFGNGAAMRISPVADYARSEEEVKRLSRIVTEVTHNHPEGLKGAEATAVAVYLARTGSSKEEIRSVIEKKYYGKYGRTLADLQAGYAWEDGCEGTVPPALVAFFESTDYEDCIRNGISIGGDSDTICAIAGAVAEAYYGIPTAIREEGIRFLDDRLKTILLDFEKVYPPKIV